MEKVRRNRVVFPSVRCRRDTASFGPRDGLAHADCFSFRRVKCGRLNRKLHGRHDRTEFEARALGVNTALGRFVNTSGYRHGRSFRCALCWRVPLHPVSPFRLSGFCRRNSPSCLACLYQIEGLAESTLERPPSYERRKNTMLINRFWRKNMDLRGKNPRNQAKSARILPFQWKMFYVE